MQNYCDCQMCRIQRGESFPEVAVKIKTEKISTLLLELCWKIEELPASEKQTEVSIMVNKIKKERFRPLFFKSDGCF